AFTTRGIAPAETCFRLGNELLRINRLDASEPYFNQALKLAPKSPMAFEGLGLLAAERGQHDEAVRYFRESLQHGSANFLAHYINAREQFRLTSKEENQYTTLEKNQAADIRAELHKSLVLMPDFGPAHHLLGFLEMLQGEDLAAAEQHLQRAIQLEPENQPYLLSLAQAQVIRKEPDAARRTLETLRLPQVDTRLRAQAEAMIQQLGRQAEPNAPGR